MTKLANIFIIGSLIIASALTKVTLFQCLLDGSLCITQTCCDEEEAPASCCENDTKKETKLKGICCAEVDLAKNTVLSDQLKNHHEVLKGVQFFPASGSLFSQEQYVSFRKISRGPPLRSSFRPPTSKVIYIANCSFLC